MVNSNGRPDKPLIVKCTFERWNKRISFASARNCTFELLKTKVEQCFSLSASPFAIAYKDDDGEVTDITTEGDLTEAIQYFQAGADEVSSSAASILSGRSLGNRKITLRVHVVVDYDGPSLSDTSSLVSLDDYKAKSESFSLGGPPSIIEPDDDAITVSSRDITGRFSALSLSNSLSPYSSSHTANQEPPLLGEPSNDRSRSRSDRSSNHGRSRKLPTPPVTHTERNPFDDGSSLSEDSAVFERLKLQEAMRDDTSSVGPEQMASYNRGTEWLRDQNERAIHSLRAGMPNSTDSDSSSQSLQPESFDGDLALERDTRGKYYYTYTSGSSGASQSQELGDINTALEPAMDEDRLRKPRPTSRQLDWLATQQAAASKPSSSQRALEHEPPIMEESVQVPPELLQYLPVPSPSADDMTDCSNCGRIIESMRYVCAVCGEKAPSSSKGKGRDIVDHQHSQHLYPPQPPQQRSPGSSSTQTGSSDTLLARGHANSYRFLPSTSSFNSEQSGSSGSFSEGYELCAMCIELVGVTHAIEAGLEHASSPVTSPSSPEDAQRALQWRRSAPRQKGRIRHAYQEKMWGHSGWEDVELDGSGTIQCSGCQIVTPPRKCYRCASCVNYHLCRACYSQVHDVHPSHVFLVWPEKHGPHTTRTLSDPEMHIGSPGSTEDHDDEEESLKHPGVKCAHCMQDIVGARFHCAICDAVDICSNCESAGLPGNLDSADGGHSSSHIVIKIPYPLEMDELEMASRRAKNLWTVRDAVNVGFNMSASKAGSVVSTSYTGTVMGNGAPSMDHRISCSSCSKPIIGVRYQCGSCPSSPISYNLCSECEGYSYLVHDPKHAFFKLPRPVDRPLEDRNPLLPLLYKQPVGQIPGVVSEDDPKAYLNYLIHSSAICDRCMTCIQGPWFRCAYCGKDLCDSCQDVDTHNDSHFFMVFKALVDMQVLKDVADIERPRPIVDYAVYKSDHQHR